MRTRWVNNLTLISPSWICVDAPSGTASAGLFPALAAAGFQPLSENAQCYVARITGNWSDRWVEISEILKTHGLHETCQVGVIGGEHLPASAEIASHYKSAAETDSIAGSMWLLEALTEKRINCYFQPVIDRRGKVFGYESLVRATARDGSTINGGAVFKASKVLRIEHLIDRALHEMAIRSYTEQNLDGFLFINLIPGFIQRPEFYLEGLSEAVAECNMSARHVVLDCTKSETPRDLQHMKSIFEYCRLKAYLVSLDDIQSVESARRFMREMRPDFIKLDMRLVRRAAEPDALEEIRKILQLARGCGATVIAEGVETKEIHTILLEVGLDLFQGYLFSPPEQEAIRYRPAKKPASPPRKTAARKS